MKLSNAAITAIEAERKTILALALVLDRSEQWMRRVLENNKENGPLTTIAALKCIRDHTGLTDDQLLQADQLPIAV